jgi:hypothetical protein
MQTSARASGALSAAAVQDEGTPIICGASQTASRQFSGRLFRLRQGGAALDDVLAIVPVMLDHRAGVTGPPHKYLTFVRLERRFSQRRWMTPI